MSIKNSVDFDVLLSFSLVTNFKGTCSPVEILKGYMFKEALRTLGLNICRQWGNTWTDYIGWDL